MPGQCILTCPPDSMTDSNSATPPATSPLQWLLIKAVHGYQVALRPFIGNRCRFLPTCSEYAIDAIRVHGCIKGMYLAVHRICRCNPCVEARFDPVVPPSN